MGRVVTEATIENLKDLWAAERGLIPADQVRRVIVPDALVDTGATTLSLPTAVIRQLGLTRTGSKQVRSSTGLARGRQVRSRPADDSGPGLYAGRPGSPRRRAGPHRPDPPGAPRLRRRPSEPATDRQPGPRGRARVRDVLKRRVRRRCRRPHGDRRILQEMSSAGEILRERSGRRGDGPPDVVGTLSRADLRASRR